MKNIVNSCFVEVFQYVHPLCICSISHIINRLPQCYTLLFRILKLRDRLRYIIPLGRRFMHAHAKVLHGLRVR